MYKTWTLYKREMGEYFNSPIAYIAIVVFLLLAGGWGLTKIFSAEPPRADMRPLFELMPMFMVVIAPALAMRLLAEEKSSGTMELLITMPVGDWQVVLTKFFAAFSVLFLMMLFTLPFAFTVAKMGDLDWGVTFGSYVGLLLMGACYISIGLMASSWFKSQVVAFIVAATICFVFWVFGWEEFTKLIPQKAAAVSRQIFGLDYHFKNFAKGIIDLRDIIYYASIAACCLVLAGQSVQSRKWR
jgi:ABC-2 type transport system permease protein